MTETNEYKGHCIIIRDDKGNVIQNPTIEWHYPSGVGAWGRDEIISEPMNPGDIIWLATQRKELLEALEDVTNDLEAYVDAQYLKDGKVYHPAMQSRYDRDIEPVLNARSAIAKARGEQ